MRFIDPYVKELGELENMLAKVQAARRIADRAKTPAPASCNPEVDGKCEGVDRMMLEIRCSPHKGSVRFRPAMIANFFVTFTIAWLPSPLFSQVADPAQVITAQNIARHISVIAHDSMRGRETPSRELELTARYVAGELERYGVQPDPAGTTPPSLVRRYSIPLALDFAGSRLVFSAGGKQAVAGFTTAASLARQAAPQGRETRGVLLLAGQHTVKSVSQLLKDIRKEDYAILYVVPTRANALGSQKLIRWLVGGDHPLIILSHEDTAAFAGRMQSQFLLPVERSKIVNFATERDGWSAYVRSDAVQELPTVLAIDGIDVNQLRTDSAQVARILPSMRVAFEPKFNRAATDTATAPIVLGILPGSDPKLQAEYIVISAHMDHIGMSSGSSDSVNNGADDNASGVAGLIELAKALSQSTPQPRRSFLFVATSGGAKKELWGSRFFLKKIATKSGRYGRWRVVGTLNLDMIGGGNGNEVMVDGLKALTLPVPLDWSVAAYPELRLTVADGGGAFDAQSDHFVFTSSSLAIPSLSFHTGRHSDRRRQVADTTMVIDADRTARIVRLVFYVSRTIADADNRPAWNAEGRRQLAESSRWKD